MVGGVVVEDGVEVAVILDVEVGGGCERVNDGSGGCETVDDEGGGCETVDDGGGGCETVDDEGGECETVDGVDCGGCVDSGCVTDDDVG